MNTEDIVKHLNEATKILSQLASDLMPEMDVIEFQKTPLGSAIYEIEKAVELITDDDGGEW